MEIKIKLLSEELINRIAAGEVIESPASAVKELVENSLDAGAAKIRVEIKGGGLLQIKIDDDGCGMSKADALLSLKRHATSKISEFDDLMKVRTMGFRGEALASIAAISSFRLWTANSLGVGTRLFSQGGEIVEVKEEGRAQGTSIEINSLFYNVPVRKKFQKSASQLGADVLQAVQKLALAHPETGFEFISQGREIFSSPGSSLSFGSALKLRAKELLGDIFIKDSKELCFEEGPVKLEGFIGSPQNGKRSRSGQFTYVNRRPVFSSLVSSALKEGYGTFLEKELFPIFILHCGLPCDLVDVNVHPQKSQVALREGKYLKDIIVKAVSKVLQASSESRIMGEVSFQKREEHASFDIAPSYERFKEEELFAFKESHFVANSVKYLWPYHLLEVKGHPKIEEGLFLLDVKSALARVLFDDLMKPDSRTSQMLAFPLIIALTPEEGVIAESFAAEFSSLGIELRAIAKDAIAIDAIPAEVEENQFKELFFELLKDFSSFNSSAALHILKKKKVAQSVCRFAQGLSALGEEKSYALFYKLLNSQDFLTDPLGRPIFVNLKGEDFKIFFSKVRGDGEDL